MDTGNLNSQNSFVNIIIAFISMACRTCWAANGSQTFPNIHTGILAIIENEDIAFQYFLVQRVLLLAAHFYTLNDIFQEF